MSDRKIYSVIGLVAPVYDLLEKLVGYEASVKYFISKLPIEQEQAIEVLDAGFGTGPYSLAVLKRFPNARITAFDADPSLIARLKERLEEKDLAERAEIRIGDITSASILYDKQFDLIITAGVLEYVSIDSVVKQLAKGLKPGGYFFNSPVRDTAYGRLVAWIYGCRAYSNDTNKAAFTNAGLRLEQTIKLTPGSPASFKVGHVWLSPSE